MLVVIRQTNASDDTASIFSKTVAASRVRYDGWGRWAREWFNENGVEIDGRGNTEKTGYEVLRMVESDFIDKQQATATPAAPEIEA